MALLLLSACAPALIATSTPVPTAVSATQTIATSATPLPATATVTFTPSGAGYHPDGGTGSLTPAPAQVQETAAPAATSLPSPTPDSRLSPQRWQEWPVLPELSAKARLLIQDGLARGANPKAFAKVGDCETLTDWFLVDFDKGARFYNLGPYSSLQAVIDRFSGSFQRKSIASMRGFTAASALSPIWADPQVCKPGETPLACEYRVQKPLVSFIMLGTNDVNHKATFEANLRKIIEISLSQGVLPILTTKADNLEGDNQLNRTIAALAYEYDIPLWNYWLAVQPLPNHGLQADGAHLTHAPNHFELPDALQSAWPLRNLQALQVLQVITQATPQK